MAKQSHGLRINIGSLKPGSGQAQNIATGAPSSGNRDRTNVNHTPKPGSAAVGPRQDGNQGSVGSSLRGSESNPATGPNVTRIEGAIRQGQGGYAGGPRPKQPGRNSVRKPS